MTSFCAAVPGAASVGVPEKFVGSYRAAQALLARLEGLCHDRRALEALRASPAWASFQGRWKLSVYFGLRFQVLVPLPVLLACTHHTHCPLRTKHCKDPCV